MSGLERSHVGDQCPFVPSLHSRGPVRPQPNIVKISSLTRRTDASRGSGIPVKMRALVLGLLSAWTLLAPLHALADFYRFTDSNGVVHYTNVSPDDAARQRLLAHAANARVAGQVTGEPPSCISAPRNARYGDFVREAAQLYSLPVSLIWACIWVASGFDSDAISENGAMGLMQLDPVTARAMGVLNAFDLRQNVLGGARYLRVLANRFNGDLVLTVAAYFSDRDLVERFHRVPDAPETRHLVQDVLHHYRRLTQCAQDSAPSKASAQPWAIRPRPVTSAANRTPESPAVSCTPGYRPCIPEGPDVDCQGGRGDGPRYISGPVFVTGSDPYGLDRDHDGIGCE
jgi:hypothetical protein